MTNENKRAHRCCFTGHRPEKLNMPEETVKKLLEEKIDEAIADGFYVFISGMARGVDIWAAEIVLKKREEDERIKLVCAAPYKGFQLKWSMAWQKRYNDILNRSDFIKYVCDKFSMGSFQKRNEWMVDRSARLIAVYNGEAGGTRNTVEYAKRQNIQVVTVN